jgi:hypothetical protein
MKPSDYPEFSLRRHIARRYKNLDYLSIKSDISKKELEEFMDDPTIMDTDTLHNLCFVLEFELTEEEEDSGCERW